MEMIEKVFDAFRPQNAAGHLVGESAAYRIRITNRHRVHIANHGDVRER